MRTIDIEFDRPSLSAITQITSSLKKGEVVAYPTDTIYGLGCLISAAKAIKKIRRIKQRDKDKPMLVLVSSLAMLKRYFHVSRRQEEYLKTVWPGQVSVILRQKGAFGKELLGSAVDPAVRLPNNVFLVRMIKMAGEPIVSTSLNLSGQKPLTGPEGIEAQFDLKPDLAIDIGRKLKGKPSRLIDLRDFPEIKIIRK